VHRGVSQNQHGNQKPTLRGTWVRMDFLPEDCRRYLGLFGIYISNQLPSTANVMHGLLLIITSESYLPSSSLTLYFVPHYIKETKEKGERSKHKPRYTATINQLSNQKISINHNVKVIHSISYLIRANVCRNTQFINDAKKLEVLLVFAEYSLLASG